MFASPTMFAAGMPYKPKPLPLSEFEGKRLFSQSYDVPILKNGQVITRIYSQTFDENGQYIS